MGMYQSIEFSNMKGAFWAGYEARYDGNYASLIANIHSGVNGEDVILATVGGVRGVREWQGERVTHSPAGYRQTISNRVYENNITIPIESYRRSGSELWEPKVREMGALFADHWESLAVEVMLGSSLGLDGKTLFSTSHDAGAGTTQSNSITNSDVGSLDVATAAAPTADEMASVLVDTAFYLQTLKNEQGVPVNKGAKGFLLLSSNPKIVASAKGAIARDMLAQGSTSAVGSLIKSDGFSFEARLETGLGAANSAVFYIVRTDSETKGIVLLDEFPVEAQELGDGTDYATLYNKYLFGMKAVRGAGPGAWQRMVKATLS